MRCARPASAAARRCPRTARRRSAATSAPSVATAPRRWIDGAQTAVASLSTGPRGSARRRHRRRAERTERAGEVALVGPLGRSERVPHRRRCGADRLRRRPPPLGPSLAEDNRRDHRAGGSGDTRKRAAVYARKQAPPRRPRQRIAASPTGRSKGPRARHCPDLMPAPGPGCHQCQVTPREGRNGWR